MLEALPLTTNGKLNRSALPAPAGLLENIVCEYVAPRNEVEEMLVAEWTKLFKIEGIGIHHNFFELGGYSLTAARLVYLLNQALSIQLPLRAIFDEPTVAGQASLIQDLLLADLERLSEDQAVSLSQNGDGDVW
jgi:acyl carrier protein